jgi:sugar/nucleoside kinase (ribokinase family)
LGYLLLLDRMDEPDSEYGTVAARVLRSLQQKGIKTSVDVVSEDSDRFKRIVPSALKFVDYLILNEVETARVVGRTVRKKNDKLDGGALAAAVEDLYGLGDMQMVVVHMPEGVYIRDRAGKRYSSGSLKLPDGFIKGKVGAGDAFCAGILYGLHEGWDFRKSAYLGSCCAAASLSHEGATDGVGPLDEVLALGKKYPEGPAPVKV